MYGHSDHAAHRFVWILDDAPAPSAPRDIELWGRYVELRADVETTLEALGMIRNWLDSKLREINYEKDDVVGVLGWEMKNALSHVEVTSQQLRQLPEKHLLE